MELILASASPRRKELLEKIGLPFTVQPAKGEERITQKSPADVVMELSRQKAEEIAAAQTEDCIIIGADTVVARGEKIMGKPKDAADAKQMLRSIADDCHQVYTGVTLIRTGAYPQSVTFQEKQTYASIRFPMRSWMPILQAAIRWIRQVRMAYRAISRFM